MPGLGGGAARGGGGGDGVDRAPAAPAEGGLATVSLLATVGLADRAAARVDELLGGQQQRVALARVLVQDPPVVLADEPFASLDPGLTAQLADLLLRICEGRTLVALLHDVALALERFPRIVGLRGGKVLFDLPASEVTSVRLEELYGGAG